MLLTTDSETDERAPEEMATLDPVMDEAMPEVTPEGAATSTQHNEQRISMCGGLDPPKSCRTVVSDDSLPAQRADCKLTAAAWSSAEQLAAIQVEAAAKPIQAANLINT